MPNRRLKGSAEKLVYRNERYTKGTITSNDPMYEGSFRRLINFNISNQNASLEQRDPFITVPLYNTQNKPIRLSKESFSFSFNEDTNYFYIVDFKTEKIKKDLSKNYFEASNVITITQNEKNMLRVIDGDTVVYKNKRYRLSLIDAPELIDDLYQPIYDQTETNLGTEAKTYVHNKLKEVGTTIYFVQFEFQTELIDEFGRELVYVFYGNNNKLLNFELLEKGFARLYGMENYKLKTIQFEIPEKVRFNNQTFNLYNMLVESYKNNPNNQRFAYSKKYMNIEVEFNKQTHYHYFKKPKVYKLLKETNLEKGQVEFNDDVGNVTTYQTKIFKRIVDEFDLNELTAKIDLELPHDYSLRYELVSKEHTVLNSKYGNQTLNFFVSVYDITDTHIYTGLAEITRTSPDPDNGIYETFHIKTYKKPEMHVEFQDITNYKPNIASDRSVIPETIIGKKANVQGITTPKVNAVLLNGNFNKHLEIGQEEEHNTTRYFLTNTPKTVDLNNFNINPIFKAPYIKEKNNYMYRWDIIQNRELTSKELENLEEFNPIFRSDWADLNTEALLLNTPEYKKRMSVKFENILSATEIYLVVPVQEKEFDHEKIEKTFSENLKIIKDSEDIFLFEYDESIEKYIEDSSYETLASILNNNGLTIPFKNNPNKSTEYKIQKINHKTLFSFFASSKDEESDFKLSIDLLDEDYKEEFLSNDEAEDLIDKIENNEERVAFVFAPFVTEIKNVTIEITTNKKINESTEMEEIISIEEKEKITSHKRIFFSSKSQGFILENRKHNFLPVNISLKHLDSKIYKTTTKMEELSVLEKEALSSRLLNLGHNLFERFAKITIPKPKTRIIRTPDLKITYEDEYIDKEEFFKEGFTAIFYLYNYESEEELNQPAEFYDNVAYKSSSPTYTFKEGTSSPYNLSDFIDDKLDKESYMIKYCKYITQYNDRSIVYGNPMYNNIMFMSEEGSPYYYSLTSAFEFDHEIIHVQQFKTILMVFTINDIWVVYEIEESEKQQYQDEEGKTQTMEIKKKSFRSKKILYNISTTHENKSTIKNISRYVTLMSNDVLYLIKPSLYISDDTQFTLNILSTNIDSLVKYPLPFINERLIYYGIKTLATEYKMNLNATDNFIKLYYSVFVEDRPYTLILTYDMLNNRWYEEDTLSFGYPQYIYLVDSSTKYEMLTVANDQLYITYNTDKYKNLLMNKYGESYFDIYPTEDGFEEQRIQYYIDTGNIKLSEHLIKRFRLLQIQMKNLDSKEVLFSYNFSVDDIQFENNFIPEISVNNSNELIELETIKEKSFKVADVKEFMFKLKHKSIFGLGFLDDFFLDFSNLTSSDIMMLRHNLIGRGRIPRVKMNFSSKNRFYILSFGIIYSEKRGK